MSRLDLKKWPVLRWLGPEFVTNIRMVVVYGMLGQEALIVTRDDMVYALGSNESGCLGTGSRLRTLDPQKVEVLCQKRVQTFAYGSGPHVLALTNWGEVYSWGYNQNFELGNEKSDDSPTASLLCRNLGGSVVVDIACGSHHSLALTDAGEVFIWGSNKYNQITNSAWKSHGRTPEHVGRALSGRKIVSIACMHSSSIAVTDTGKVYGWGYNGKGELGLGNNSKIYEPSKVTALDSIFIVKVVCGYGHTLALSDDGALYVWGRNHYGQLGLGNREDVASPVKVSVPEMGPVSDVAAVHYNNISVAIGHGNCVYVWGQCGGQSITCPLRTRLAHPHDAFAFHATPSVMHKPLLLLAEQEETIGASLLNCLKNAFDDASTSDLIIQVQGNPIHVHKSVLKIRSQYFRSMFKEHWAEYSQNTLQLDQFSHAVYKSFLRYLYTDEIDVSAEEPLELLELANAYCDTEFKERCIQVLKHGITVENAASMLPLFLSHEVQCQGVGRILLRICIQ